MKLAILYAGQGSQHPGMGKDLYERYPAFREAFNAADLDFDLESVCFDDPEGVLNLTQYTQPCMTAFAGGVTAVLRAAGITPDYAAGLSLGEYSALACAGVFDARTAVALTAFRGKAMAAAAAGRSCGMTAVLAENDISEKSYYYLFRKLCREVCEQEGLQEVTNPSALSFVEIPVKTALDTTPVPAVPAAMTPVAVIRSGRLTLELSNDISESLLCRLLQEVLHA